MVVQKEVFLDIRYFLLHLFVRNLLLYRLFQQKKTYFIPFQEIVFHFLVDTAEMQ